MMENNPMLQSKPDAIPNFSSKKEVCAIYVEWDQKILTCSNPLWSLPGGELNTDERASSAALRLLQQQVHLTADDRNLTAHGPCYLRSSDGDSTIHMFRLVLPQRPDHLTTARWISIFAYKILHEIENRPAPRDGSLEAFDFVYSHRIWRPIDSSTLVSSSSDDQKVLALQKNGKTLHFGPNCRLIITFIGTAYSGKATQANLLGRILGLPSISDGEIYEAEARGSPLKKMVAAYTQAYPQESLPSELPIGMMAKRLSSTDCHAGYILRGFPLTLEQSRVFTSIFCRNKDLIIPIFLNISNDEVQNRILDNDHGFARRRSDFEAGKDKVLTQLGQSSSFARLDLNGRNSVDDVLHRIYTAVDKRLDALQTRRQCSRPGTPLQESKGRPLSQLGWMTACVASAAIVAFLIGRNMNR